MYSLAGEMINVYSQLVHDPGCIGNKLYVYIYIYIYIYARQVMTDAD